MTADDRPRAPRRFRPSSAPFGPRPPRPRPVIDNTAQAKALLAALQAAQAAAPEQRDQAYAAWLKVATAAQVKRHWREWMGPRPSWA